MIYFDNNATTQLAPQVRDAMLPFLGEGFGNPSSAHSAGRAARDAVDHAREDVAQLLHADSTEIVFTSGGTESDNWAIRAGLSLQTGKRHIVTTRVEHEAVRRVCEDLERHGFEITWLDVDEDGSLDLDALAKSLKKDTAIVSIMLANNETGVLFPMDEIGGIVREHSDALFHVDGVNAAGKVPIDLSSGVVDLFSISAHKFHGPKGMGALYIRDGVNLPPVMMGGGQEAGRRPGTEAVHQIAGIGAAARMVWDLSAMEKARVLRDRLESSILRDFPNASLNGLSNPKRRLPNTSSISFENVNGEMILMQLDAAGICVSTGSACNSADHKPSAVLEAMNIPYSKAMGSIRFSLGRFNTGDEVDMVLAALSEVIPRVAGIAG